MRISDWSSEVCSSDLRASACTGTSVINASHAPIAAPVVRRLIAKASALVTITGVIRLVAASATASRSKRISRSEEHTSELQSLMRISYAVFCLKKKKEKTIHTLIHITQTQYT